MIKDIGEGLPRSRRLRKSPDFRRVQRGGRRIHGASLVIIHRRNDLDGPRIGLAVSRKVGNAVVRNRVKRWLREIVRRRLGALPAVDVVLIARPSAATAGYPNLSVEVDHALERIQREHA